MPAAGGRGVPALLPLSLLQLAVAACASAHAGPAVDTIASATAGSETRTVFATVSTLNGTSPRFPCNASTAKLVFRPLAASPTARLRTAATVGGEDYCWLAGADAAGEYAISRAKEQAEMLVVKAIALDRPVRNLGGEVVFTESWTSPRLQDGDASADTWRAAVGCGAAKPTGALALSPACTVTSVPHEARTFNFFRHPLTLTVEGVRASGSAARIALAVPSAAAVSSTGWPSVKHYNQPLRNASSATEAATLAGSAASLAAVISADGMAQLQRRRVAGGPVAVLGRAQLPAGCGHATPATVSMFAGSVFTVSTGGHSGHGGTGGSPAPPLRVRLQVFCGPARVPAANISADLGLGFLDADGFGETVGEAVIELSAINSLASKHTPPSPTVSAVTIGRIQITNDLEPSFSPAVLAPVTDRVGTVNWDHGSLGNWYSAERKNAFGPKEGILDVTMPPFDADNSGMKDATLALQSAIDFARHNYLSLWLPAGEYKVTESLQVCFCVFVFKMMIFAFKMMVFVLKMINCVLKMMNLMQALQHPRQSGNGFAGLNLTANFCFNRFTSWTIRGEVLRSDAINPAPPSGRGRPGRATLVLPPNTPAFALVSGSETPPLAVLNVSSVNSHSELEPNVLMNTIVQSVDVIIGAGNPTAVGMRMRGAQGSGLEDIGVFAATDAFAGISGVSGSGGAHSNITVVGARFGVDARDTQPSASLTNVRLINQSCAALVHTGLETLTMAGVFIGVNGGAQHGAAAIITGSPSHLPELPTHGAILHPKRWI